VPAVLALGAWLLLFALDHRFQRDGAIDVEFSDLWRASLCVCRLGFCG
jgi:hypothetical protein